MIGSIGSLNTYNAYIAINNSIDNISGSKVTDDFEDCYIPSSDLNFIGAKSADHKPDILEQIKEIMENLFKEMLLRKLPIDYDKLVELTNKVVENASPEDLEAFYKSSQSGDMISTIEGFQQLLASSNCLSQEDFDYLNSLLENLKEKLVKDAKDKVVAEIVDNVWDNILSENE